MTMPFLLRSGQNMDEPHLAIDQIITYEGTLCRDDLVAVELETRTIYVGAYWLDPLRSSFVFRLDAELLPDDIRQWLVACISQRQIPKPMVSLMMSRSRNGQDKVTSGVIINHLMTQNIPILAHPVYAPAIFSLNSPIKRFAPISRKEAQEQYIPQVSQ
jgi:hypothetical protein